MEISIFTQCYVSGDGLVHEAGLVRTLPVANFSPKSFHLNSPMRGFPHFRRTQSHAQSLLSRERDFPSISVVNDIALVFDKAFTSFLSFFLRFSTQNTISK